MPTTQDYRSDIDGLRAIAVLSVIIFHLDKTLLPGGFIGVDIFFVISGFLISLNIFRDLDRQRFSFREFYRRRIKRIMPAMLATVAASLLIAQVVMRPEDAERTAESGLWSIFSLANFYFWLRQDVGYFAAASDELPLLHLWSLGVEEQFYLVWPILLACLYRRTSAQVLFVTTVSLSLASFVLAELVFEKDPSFGFYMLPTRFGGLMAGALVALAVMNKPKQTIPSWLVAPSAIVGMFLIVSSLFLLSDDAVFPGLWAVPPTVGTALLILAGHCGNSWLSQALRWPPFTWVGLISYSAYLWHWPLVAFFRYGSPTVGLLSGSVIFILTLFFGWLSYRYIECPARRSDRPALQVIFRQWVAPAGALAFIAFAAMKLDGYGARWFTDYRATVTALREHDRPAYSYEYICQRQLIRLQDVTNDRCIVGPTGHVPYTLLWGDSNAAHYVGMIGAFATAGGFRFRNVEVGLCPPILSDPKLYVTANRLHDCRSSISVLREVLNAHNVIIISASWTFYQRRSGHFIDTFFDTVRTLSSNGKTVILVGKIPVISNFDRLCQEKALSYPFLECPLPESRPTASITRLNARLKDFADSAANVEYFDATPYLCPNATCAAFAPNGSRIYYDASHITTQASWDLGERIVRGFGVPLPFKLIADNPPPTIQKP